MTKTRPDYERSLEIGAPRGRVFDAISTLEGLRGWWTPLASGSTKRGGTFRLRFEGMDEHIDIRVASVRRPSALAWTILEHTSLDEWAETSVSFALNESRGDHCILHVRHVGLTPVLACYEDCRAGWDHFLASLVSLVEKGEGEPFRGRKRRTKAASDDPSKTFAAVGASLARAHSGVAHAATERRGFGSNALRYDGRIFAMLVRGDFVVKLPSARVDALVASGEGTPFLASRGRVMREWIAVASVERSVWRRFAHEAYDFVSRASRGRAKSGT